MNKDEILNYYSTGIEKERLHRDYSKLEGIRSKEIISRYLHSKGLRILDIGGATGFYSFWLQSLGHEVSLYDLSPDNIAIAKNHGINDGIPLADYRVGDAVSLPYEDNRFDLVLLFGPLYHLTDKTERLQAISEARRVLKPNGVLLNAVISRYASLIDGFKRNLISDEQFVSMVKQDLQTGIHLNRTDNPEYFTTAFFHSPDEIKIEIIECHLKFEKLIAVESVGWMIDELSEKSNHAGYLNKVLDLITTIESNVDFIAVSPHIIAVARKTK